MAQSNRLTIDATPDCISNSVCPIIYSTARPGQHVNIFYGVANGQSENQIAQDFGSSLSIYFWETPGYLDVNNTYEFKVQLVDNPSEINFSPPFEFAASSSTGGSSGLSSNAKAGIAAGVTGGVLVVATVVAFFATRYKKRKNKQDQLPTLGNTGKTELDGVEMKVPTFHSSKSNENPRSELGS